MSYCSLAEAKRELKAESSVDDDTLLGYIRQVSRRIDSIQSPQSMKMPYFEPYQSQQIIEVKPTMIDSWYSNSLRLPKPLLSFSEVTLNNQDITSVLEQYPLWQSPITALRLTNFTSWYSYCSGVPGPHYLRVTGLWGYHRDYANAWEQYDDVTLSTFTPAETSFTVADVDGLDPFGLTPRFSPGQLIRIGSGTEIMVVSDTDTALNSVTAQRAQYGTSLPAVDYQIGDDVFVFQTELTIRRVVARQSGLLYARKGAFEAQQLDGQGIAQYPTDLLTELKQALTEYQYV